MKLKYLLVPAATFCLLFSDSILAEGKGNPHQGGPDARWENSNRQSDKFSRKGQDRAEERHRQKQEKKYKHKRDKKFSHKKNKYRDDDRYEHDRYRDEYKRKRHDDDEKYPHYERQRYEERYRNNPIDTIIDRNINEAKSKIDNIHRKAIESIDVKTRQLTGIESHREKARNTKPWWSLFGGE